MVLSSPPSDAAQNQATRSWIGQLLGTLELVRGAALLLVDKARPEALGALVRGLSTAFPSIDVVTNVVDVLAAAEGSTLIWCLETRDAERANLERPVFADRRLKVILFAPKRVSDAYAREAPDFFSWITEYVECPDLPWAPAVRGLTLASRATGDALGIRWARGDLDSAFSHAFPLKALVRRSASLAYDELVQTCAETPEWIAWRDIDGPYRLRRVTWAAAEARRVGRLILEKPMCATPGFWPVSGRMLPVSECRELLRKAGARHPGRLSALLECEPEALRLAAAWLRAGGNPDELEAAVFRADDGGAEVARWALHRGVAHQRPSPPILRGVGTLPLWLPEDRIREGLNHPQELRESWAALAEKALDAGDARVALLWAQRSLQDDSGTEAAQIAVSRSLFAMGLTHDAMQFLEQIADPPLRDEGQFQDEPDSQAAHRTRQKARALLAVFRARLRQGLPEDITVLRGSSERVRKSAPTTAQLPRLLQALGFLYSQAREFEEAFRTLQEALVLENRLSGSERKKLLTARHGLAMLLRERGSLREAAAMAKGALDTTRDWVGDEHPFAATCHQGLGMVLASQGEFVAARHNLERAVRLKRRLYGEEHPSTISTIHELGKVNTELGDYETAEQLLETARMRSLSSVGAKSPTLAEILDALGRLRRKQGRNSQAEELFRQATEIRAASLGPAHPETLESVQGLSQVAADDVKRHGAIGDFLNDLNDPSHSRFRKWLTEGPMKSLYVAHGLLGIPSRLDALERRGSLAATTAGVLRWVFFKPLAFLSKKLGHHSSGAQNDPDHKVAVTKATQAVSSAVIAKAAQHESSERLAKVAIQQVREVCGSEHPFTRDVERALGK